MPVTFMWNCLAREFELCRLLVSHAVARVIRRDARVQAIELRVKRSVEKGSQPRRVASQRCCVIVMVGALISITLSEFG